MFFFMFKPVPCLCYADNPQTDEGEAALKSIESSKPSMTCSRLLP